MAIVYKHVRKDSNEVFYIGIGSDPKRAYSKANRSNYWHNIVKKVGYEVEIIQEGLTWEKACQEEIKLIAEYGRVDLGTGLLVNQTNGGEGLNNPSAEIRCRMSEAKTGKQFSEQHKHNLSEAHKGISRSLEARQKQGQSNRGSRRSEETKKKMSKAQKGRLMTEQHRQRISEARKGKKRGSYKKKLDN